MNPVQLGGAGSIEARQQDRHWGMTIPRWSTRWRHDVGDALIAEHLAHTWFGRSSPDSYRAGPMSATEALGQCTKSLRDRLAEGIPHLRER